jgi:hypothetical protein
MLGGCFVDIADFPITLGSETTHVAGTTRASGKAVVVKRMPYRVVNRPISRSARPTEDSEIPSTKRSCIRSERRSKAAQFLE